MRPKKQRCIGCQLTATVFKPRGIPTCELEMVSLEPDETEALRLADVERMHHVTAGEQMGVSRATFGRILERARGKVARALIHQHAIELCEPKEDVTMSSSAGNSRARSVVQS